MKKNLKRYYKVWELRQQGKKLQDIAQIMGFKSGENARRMVCFVNFKIKSNTPKSNELKRLISKYSGNLTKSI